MVFNKFTGARGKSGSNDANAEYVAHIRAIMEESGVAFQTAELGKIDVGGGGTIAYILALYGMNVIDCGVAFFPCWHRGKLPARQIFMRQNAAMLHFWRKRACNGNGRIKNF